MHGNSRIKHVIQLIPIGSWFLNSHFALNMTADTIEEGLFSVACPSIYNYLGAAHNAECPMLCKWGGRSIAICHRRRFLLKLIVANFRFLLFLIKENILCRIMQNIHQIKNCVCYSKLSIMWKLAYLSVKWHHLFKNIKTYGKLPVSVTVYENCMSHSKT